MFRFIPLSAVVAVLFSSIALAAPPYGLDAPQPVAPFFGGVFPNATPGGTGGWTVVDAFPNLSFTDPVAMKPEPSGNRLFVVGKLGQIWHFDNDPAATTKTLFLDISSRVQVTDNAGLVGLVFHPEFGQTESPNRGYFYIFYYHSPNPYALPPGSSLNDNPNGAYVHLSRFNVPDGSSTADPASEYVMIQQWDAHHWHNGGAMFFGADEFLYVSSGDQGGDYDGYNVTQRLDGALLNGILRIDVEMDNSRSHDIRRQPQADSSAPAAIDALMAEPGDFSRGYTIPDDNPWLDPAGSILEEFWCTGLRSPHSMHYDPITGDIFVGDVGQGSREEIDKIVKAGNYQWPFKEGDINGPKAKPASITGTEVTPIHSYPRNVGVCVIVGPVYRGAEHGAALGGKLLFADHEYAKIWTMDPNGDSSSVEYLTNMPAGGFHANIASFGVDNAGEVYMVKLQGESNAGGKLYKLARTGTNVPEPPLLLSATGVFGDLATLTPATGFIPYAPNTPFWSDGSAKFRWIAIPNDGTHDTPGEKVTYSEDGEWVFPEGTVLVKHFELFGLRLETRFLVHGTGGDWYGLTYRWKPDGSDADLIYLAQTETITDPVGGGTQQWLYPGRQDCFTCHRPDAGTVLGIKTRQLNGDMLFPSTGRSANQLATWNSLGIFDTALDESTFPSLLTSVPVDDLRYSAEHRARSWLDSNCANCHRPGGVQPDFDARLSTPLPSAGIINGTLVAPFGVEGEAVVRAHDLGRSILHLRSNSTGSLGMPPLAKELPDPAGMRALENWISSLDPVANAAPGLIGEYYNNTDFTALGLTRIDPSVDFNWGNGSPSGAIGADTFSVRWTGYVVPSFSEEHTFHVRSDNGIRVWVDDSLIIDQWIFGVIVVASGTANLQAGIPASIKVEYYEQSAAAEAHLEWESANQPREVISGASLIQTAAPEGPPVAVNDDGGSVYRHQTATLGVLGNDFDYESNLAPATIEVVDAPGLGSAVVQAVDNTILYTPSGATGMDSFTYRVSDTEGHISNLALVTLGVQSHAADWRETNFPTSLGDLSISGWDADPDGDGFSNAAEYAAGTNPNSAESVPAIGLTVSGDDIDVEFPKATDAEATVVLRQSTNLTGWDPPGPAVTILEDSATKLSARIDSSAGGRLLLRFEVTIP